MIKGSLRTALLSSTAAAMLVASAGTASALEYNFGSVQVFLDTTLSAGVSMRTAKTNTLYLPQSNGGPLTDTLDEAILGAPLQVPTGTLPTNNTFIGNGNLHGMNTWQSKIAGSINTDDGRLNFDRGDLTSNIYKMTNDIQVKWENLTFFTRLNSYYDAVLDSSSSYARSNLIDGKADAARDIRVLDLYAAGNFDVGGLPLTVRAGKQVINWGEGTFILNGVNGAMPIDVGAFRRPGAEVKEGLLPIWALNASIGLPYNISLEGFYQLKQEEYLLDRPGTPFSTSDPLAMGGGLGGNQSFSFLTGSPGGNMLRNCSDPSFVSDAFTAAWNASASALTPFRDCAAGAIDYTQYDPTVAGLGGWTALTNALAGGSTEALRFAYGDTAIIARDPDRYASDSGQYGIAARWYSEALNNTEFGFYFTNTHSRLPFASERISVDPTTAAVSSYLISSGTTGQQSRLLQYNGCNLGDPVGQPSAFYGVPAGGLSTAALDALNQAVLDPDGIYAAGLAMADAFYAGAGGPVVGAPAGSPFAGGIEGTDLSLIPIVGGAFAGMANPVVQANSLLALPIANCALVAQPSTSVSPGVAPIMLVDGAEIMLASDPNTPGIGLYLEYPEDIRMYGFSFNTTLGTWGVQGDITYRPNQPVQLDTDQLTINALHRGCVFQQLVGHNTTQAFIPLDTFGPGCGSMGTGANTADLTGYERTEIYTAQVGTTATFTNSNALINMTGADLGILVTEVGAMYAPDAPSQSAPNNVRRWGNVCASGGTDLPLGGFLGLASRQGCRATSVSWGYVLLGQLQYNNAFGTALSLQPTVTWNHGVQGNSPAPLANYRQGAKAVSLALNGSYLGNWRGGISYTNYMGNEKYTNNNDMDFVSMNISYAF